MMILHDAIETIQIKKTKQKTQIKKQQVGCFVLNPCFFLTLIIFQSFSVIFL